jgi:hypothetical protein
MKRISIFSLILGLVLPWCIVSGEEKLPRVLIIGDFVSLQASQGLQKDLKGKVVVHYSRLEPDIVISSSSVLENFDKLIGEGGWDLIHFNVGLGDLIYRFPAMKTMRVLPQHAGGIRNTPPELYEKNLNTLVQRLKTTGAKLIWASTTPIRHSSTNVFEKGSEVEYNTIAAKVMKKHGIPINDMYSFVKNLINMDKPAGHGADPFFFDRKPIHPPIIEALQLALGVSLK